MVSSSCCICDRIRERTENNTRSSVQFIRNIWQPAEDPYNSIYQHMSNMTYCTTYNLTGQIQNITVPMLNYSRHF